MFRVKKMSLYIDYSKFNAITRPDVYPLPRLEELLDSSGNARYISTMDLKGGYNQIKVAEEDVTKPRLSLHLE